MGKIKFIAEEFFRSFKKSLFKNLILMVMFSISLVMAVFVSSYYLDLGETQYNEYASQEEDGAWYQVYFFWDDLPELNDLDSSGTRCRDMINYYNSLCDFEDNPVISSATAQSMYVREDDMKKYFDNQDCSVFLNTERDDPILMAYFGGGEACSVMSMKAAQFNLDAYRLFGLKISEGEGFTEENTYVESEGASIPVLLGNDYKGIINLGETFDMDLGGNVFNCKVTGILERGSQAPEFADYSGKSMVTLDSYIIFPFGVRVSENVTSVKELSKYANCDIMALSNSAAYLKDTKDAKNIMMNFKDAAQEFFFPPIILGEASVGLKLFRNESEASVRIILILTLALIGFSIYSLFVTFYDKIQSNIATYGIYLMNGCPLWCILTSFLLENAIILLPSVFVCKNIFIYDNFWAFGPDIKILLRTAYIYLGSAFLLGAAFTAYVLCRIDTEHMIRRKE